MFMSVIFQSRLSKDPLDLVIAEVVIMTEDMWSQHMIHLILLKLLTLTVSSSMVE